MYVVCMFNFLILMCVPLSVFCVLFVCKCVLFHCHRVSTQLQLNICINKFWLAFIKNSSVSRRTMDWLQAVMPETTIKFLYWIIQETLTFSKYSFNITSCFVQYTKRLCGWVEKFFELKSIESCFKWEMRKGKQFTLVIMYFLILIKWN
jgi:hypothetical protein